MKRNGLPSQRNETNPSDQIKWRRVLKLVLKRGWLPAAGLAALMIGLYAGYVAAGDQNAGDIFRLSTWRHIFDLVFAEQ